jgi:hypothetical protein
MPLPKLCIPWTKLATVQADTGTKRVIIQTTAAPPQVTAAITAAGYTVQS